MTDFLFKLIDAPLGEIELPKEARTPMGIAHCKQMLSLRNLCFKGRGRIRIIESNGEGPHDIGNRLGAAHTIIANSRKTCY